MWPCETGPLHPDNGVLVHVDALLEALALTARPPVKFMDGGTVTESDEEHTAQEPTEQSDKESDRMAFLSQASRRSTT